MTIAESRLRAVRRKRLIAGGLAGIVLFVLLAVYFQRGFVPGDAFTYLAAGERLNAGHALYALVPGDRPVGLKPPYWTVPLLSPPLIAVLWRPLAALPNELGVYLWWAGSVASIIGVLLALLIARPLVTLAAVILLAIPITYEIGVGNVNGYLLLGCVLAWRFGRGGRPAGSGAIAAVMTALKLTPLPVALWAAATGRYRAVVGLGAGGIAALALSVAGAGFAAHLDYLAIIRQTGSSGTSDLSLTGLARAAGLGDPVPAVIPYVVFGVGLGAILALRARPGAAFAVSIVTFVFASPVVNVNTPTLLLAALAPVAWPWPGPPADRPVPRTPA